MKGGKGRVSALVHIRTLACERVSRAYRSPVLKQMPLLLGMMQTPSRTPPTCTRLFPWMHGICVRTHDDGLPRPRGVPVHHLPTLSLGQADKRQRADGSAREQGTAVPVLREQGSLVRGCMLTAGGQVAARPPISGS